MQPGDDAIARESASIEIDASPETVYALVSNLERMGDWSPEAVGGRWLDGGTWWSYELEPAGSGTKLTERWWIFNKTPALHQATEEQFAARIDLTRSMLRTTIEAMKQTAESR